MSLKEFINTWNGKAPDYDGVFGPQCTDLAKLWNKELGYGPSYGNGNQWINNAGADYTRINYMPGLVPKEGDIVSWSGNPPANVPYGHVAVATGKGSTSSFETFDENWGGPTCKLNTHSYQSVQGWIRPKNYLGGGGLMIDEGQINVLYQLMLGRPAEPAGIAGKVGRPWWQVFVEIFESEERRIRETAIKDEHQRVINEVIALSAKVVDFETQTPILQGQVEALTTSNTNFQTQIDVLNTEVESLKKQLADGSVTLPAPSQPLKAASIGDLINEIFNRILRR